MLSMARSKAFNHPRPAEECWIKFQLDLRNIKFKAIAQKAGRTVAMVSSVICGDKRSERVEAALAEMLGYPTYQHLKAAATRQTKGGAA